MFGTSHYRTWQMYGVILPRSEEEREAMRRQWWKEQQGDKPVARARWLRPNKEKIQIHSRGSRGSLFSPSLFCAFVGVRGKRNNTDPRSASTIGWRERKGCLKRRAGWHSDPRGLFLHRVCGKTPGGTQTRHSFTHNHYDRRSHGGPKDRRGD